MHPLNTLIQSQSKQLRETPPRRRPTKRPRRRLTARLAAATALITRR
jgi:hypothetical protein